MSDVSEMIQLRKLFNKAYDIIEQEFGDKTDKGGNPYKLHLYKVGDIAREVAGRFLEDYFSEYDLERIRIIGMLHDLIEDTEWTLERLAEEGYTQEIIDAIDSFTRREGESYSEFCKRAMQNKFGRIVKFADLTNNLDLTRVKSVGPDDIARINKYLKFYHIFKERIDSDIKTNREKK